MSPQPVNVKPEDVNITEQRGRYTVSIVSCKRVGIIHACLFAEAGFKVLCTDMNRNLISYVAKGKSPFLKSEVEPILKKYLKKGFLKAMNDVESTITQSDIVVIATPIKTDEKGNVSYANVEKACKRVGSNIHRGSLVIVVSVVGIGIIEGLIKETLENTSGLKVGVDFGLAYSPLLTGVEQTLEDAKNRKRIIAATDKTSLKKASAIIKTITKNDVVEAENVKTAEAATIFQIAQQDVGIALANELALFCEKRGIDYPQVQRLIEASKSDISLLSRLSSLTPPRETYLLLEEAENLGVKLRIPVVARELNEEMFKRVISLIREALKTCGKPLRRAKISLLGISQTPNTKDSIKPLTKKLVRTLERKGVKVRVYDPYFSSHELTEMGYPTKKNLTENMEGADCIVIMTSHERFKRLNLKRLKVIMKKPAAIIDLVGVVEPNKAEVEGFTYRGLGRGVKKR